LASTDPPRQTATPQEPSAAAPVGAAPRYAPVTARAVALGLCGAVCVSALQVVNKAQPRTVIFPFPSAMTLFAGAVFWLFLLSVLNVALRRWFARAALRPAELAVIYGLTTVAAGIAAQDEVQYLLPMYVYPFRATQADPMGPFRQYIPAWLVPQDPEVVEPYYAGHGSFWEPEILRAWLVPLLAWMAWLLALGATMWAWNVILRRRWVEHDRLSFPSVQLPLEMCRAGGFGGMAGGRLFFFGFLVSALFESLNQLHNRFPNVPYVPLNFVATPLLETAPSPWRALAPMQMMWSTVHLGICYLIPLDILFSGWFFYVVRKLLEVWGYAMGWRELGWDARGFPYTRAQAAGSWAALFFLLVWAERHHLARVLASAFGARVALDDAGEPGSYRWAGRILILGTAFLIAWSVQSGMSLGLAVAFYAFFWILNVTMTRIYAQVGPPILELFFLDPQKTLTTVFGTLGQGPGSLTQFSLMYWINRDHRGQPMAHQLSAFYVGKAAGADPRALGRWVFVAFALGALTCLLTYLHWAYRLGEDQFVSGGWREAGSRAAISRIQEWVYTPKGPQWTEIGFVGVGGALTLLLAKVNYTFIGSPFHPIGYALAVCFAVEYNWPAFLAVWLLKGLLLRYGGLGLYLRLVPLFLGLTLGGLVVPVCWGFVAWLLEWYL
jgi:hypothetical protein